MQEDTPNDAPADRYLTVAMLADAYPAFPEPSIRWLLFNRRENGLESAVIRVGRRLLISDLGWRHWLEGQRETKPAPPTSKATTKSRRTRGTAAA